jgi:lactate dehydrogenase-like 2-hydroxyacid dehydrogenase
MSDKPVIVVSRKVPPAVAARLSRDYEPRFNDEDRLLPIEELLARAQDADGLLVCHTELMTAEVIARLPENIRVIANYSVGVDHVDLAAAKARGLIVTNTPEVLSNATAELTMLLMLGAARRASEGERLMRADEWSSWSLSFMVGTEVTGKRLGIVGLGRVGRVTARRAMGFDMEVHYHDPIRLDGALEAGAVYHDSIEELLPLAQFLALHCPATPETEGLLNARRIALLPDGAIVVNAARGAVVDDEALIAALKSGKVAAAGLDVFNNEPDIHPAYRELDNVFLLPHVGSATRETRDAMGFRALDNLDAVFAGREPHDRVA